VEGQLFSLPDTFPAMRTHCRVFFLATLEAAPSCTEAIPAETSPPLFWYAGLPIPAPSGFRHQDLFYVIRPISFSFVLALRARIPFFNSSRLPPTGRQFHLELDYCCCFFMSDGFLPVSTAQPVLPTRHLPACIREDEALTCSFFPPRTAYPLLLHGSVTREDVRLHRRHFLLCSSVPTPRHSTSQVPTFFQERPDAASESAVFFLFLPRAVSFSLDLPPLLVARRSAPCR